MMNLIVGKQWDKTSVFVVLLFLIGLSACSPSEISSTPDSSNIESVEVVNSDGGFVETAQRDLAETAMMVQEEATPTRTPVPVITLDVAGRETLFERRGLCSASSGYTVHSRDTLCAVLSDSWVSLNVDGGAVSSFNTTPGQTIAARDESDTCVLMIFITSGFSPAELLQEHYNGISSMDSLEMITPLQEYQIGELVIPGFEWQTSAEQGRIFADSVAINRLVYIKYNGTACNDNELFSVLNTLRFNIE